MYIAPVTNTEVQDVLKYNRSATNIDVQDVHIYNRSVTNIDVQDVHKYNKSVTHYVCDQSVIFMYILYIYVGD
jgi:hypothetical protein